MVVRLKIKAFSVLESLLAMVFLSVVISLSIGLIGRNSFQAKNAMDNLLFIELQNVHVLKSMRDNRTLYFKRVSVLGEGKGNIYSVHKKKDNSVVSFIRIQDGE